MFLFYILRSLWKAHGVLGMVSGEQGLGAVEGAGGTTWRRNAGLSSVLGCQGSDQGRAGS